MTDEALYLAEEWLQWVALQETDSTNNEVHRLVAEKEVLLVTAEYQSCGRGQKGNTWESQAEKNLLFSVLIHPNYVAANEQFILSQALSLAIQQTLEQLLGSKEVCIKWPNDIYWKDRKICGILIENALRGRVIESATLGVGLNVNQLVFHSDAPNPVSMAQIAQRSFSRQQVLQQVLLRFYQYLHQLKAGLKEEIVRSYFQHLYRNDGYYPYRDETGVFQARIVDVEPMGHLVLSDNRQRRRRYAFKEVEYII